MKFAIVLFVFFVFNQVETKRKNRPVALREFKNTNVPSVLEEDSLLVRLDKGDRIGNITVRLPNGKVTFKITGQKYRNLDPGEHLFTGERKLSNGIALVAITVHKDSDLDRRWQEMKKKRLIRSDTLFGQIRTSNETLYVMVSKVIMSTDLLLNCAFHGYLVVRDDMYQGVESSYPITDSCKTFCHDEKASYACGTSSIIRVYANKTEYMTAKAELKHKYFESGRFKEKGSRDLWVISHET